MVSTGVNGILYIHKCTAFVDGDSASQSHNAEKDRHNCMPHVLEACLIMVQARTSNSLGTLAGMRPCSTIVYFVWAVYIWMKSQVYGCFHKFHTLYPSVTRETCTLAHTLPQPFRITAPYSNILHPYVTYYTYYLHLPLRHRKCILKLQSFPCNAEFIVYDEACHLQRFARNPVQSDMTQQSKEHMRNHQVLFSLNLRLDTRLPIHLPRWSDCTRMVSYRPRQYDTCALSTHLPHVTVGSVNQYFYDLQMRPTHGHAESTDWQ